jgi:hypothetical protein
MSHIPSSAVPHAKTSDASDNASAQPQDAKSGNGKSEAKGKGVTADAARLGREGLATIKANPKTAFAIGATIIAGAVAAVAAPRLAKADEDKPKRARGGKKSKSA